MSVLYILSHNVTNVFNGWLVRIAGRPVIHLSAEQSCCCTCNMLGIVILNWERLSLTEVLVCIEQHMLVLNLHISFSIIVDFSYILHIVCVPFLLIKHSWFRFLNIYLPYHSACILNDLMLLYIYFFVWSTTDLKWIIFS